MPILLFVSEMLCRVEVFRTQANMQMHVEHTHVPKEFLYTVPVPLQTVIILLL